MLMVTSSVGMFNGVHTHTTHLGPAVTLGLVLEVGTASLEDRLLDTSTTGDDTDHSTVGGGNDLLGAGGELDTGLLGVGIMGNDGCVVSGGTGQPSSISTLLLEVAHNGTFGHVSDGKNITNLELSLAAAVHELTSVHSFAGKEKFLALLVAVGIAERHASKRCSTSGIVENLLHDTLDVSVALGEVDRTKFGGSLTMLVVGTEHRPGALSL